MALKDYKTITTDDERAMVRCMLSAAFREPTKVVSAMAEIASPLDVQDLESREVYAALVQHFDAGLGELDWNGFARQLVARNLSNAEQIILDSNNYPEMPELYARKVAEAARRRRVSDAIHHTQTMVDDLTKTTDDLIDESVSLIATAAAGRRQSIYHSILIGEHAKAITNGEQLESIPTGIYSIDKLIGGFGMGEMVVIAARPSMGKTALALYLADKVTENDTPLAFFSLEMTRRQVAERILAARLHVNINMLSSMVDPHGQAEMNDVVRDAGKRDLKAPMFFEFSPRISLNEFRARCRYYVKAKGVRMILLDYMGLMAKPKGSIYEAMTELSGGIKAVAMECNVPVVTLAQLNRDLEKRDNKKPIMADLRDSGAIEQDADKIIFIHRQSYYDRRDNPGQYNAADIDMAEIIVAKNRNGPCGVVELGFKQSMARFAEKSGV